MLIALALIAAMPVAKQDGAQAAGTGRVADSSVGRAGQRQTREQVVPNAEPTARIASRIENRVQNRIRNRIDRNYDPQANAVSPFKVAEEQPRTAGRRRP